jgi:hypothetical protein
VSLGVDASVPISIVAALFAGCSAFFAYYSSRVARDGIHLQALLRLSERSEEDGFLSVLDTVFNLNYPEMIAFKKLQSGAADPESFSKERRAIYKVSRFFDTIGLYVKVGILKKKPVLEVFGSVALEAWSHCSFFLRDSTLPENSYPNNFRRLADLAKKAGFTPYADAQKAFLAEKIRRASAPDATDQDKTF